MRKLLSVCLVLLLAFLLIPAAFAAEVTESGTCGENVTWTLDSEGTLTISGTGALSTDTSYSPLKNRIKKVVIEEGVTSICASAFQSYPSLSEVILPDSITSIGEFAFTWCDKLSSVTLPDSLTQLGNYCFYGCKSLTGITLPSKLTAISTGAFLDCSGLTSINIPDSVTIIWDRAFESCTGLTELTIPSSVTYVYSGAFSFCSGLTRITIPGSLTTLEGSMFGYCTGLTEVTISAGVTSFGSNPFYECGNISLITFEGDAPSFTDYSFERLYITAVYPAGNPTWTDQVRQDYGGNVTWIPSGDCVHTAVSANDSKEPTCTEPGKTAGVVCSACGIVLKKGQDVEALGHSYENSLCTRCGAVEILASDLCGDNVRYSLDTLGTLTISGTGPMWDCTEENLPHYVNYYVQSIRAVVIEEGVTNIGNAAFVTCENLTSVTIPETVTSIGDHAFLNCVSLTEVTIPGSVTAIGTWAFQGCSSLTEVTIPDSVKEIGAYAFSMCANLSSVTLPSNLTVLEEGLFWDSDAITEITLPGKLTTIGTGAFLECDGLTQITIPAKVTKIEALAFGACPNLTSITFKGNAPTFAEDAFVNVTAEIHYPDNKTWNDEVKQNYSGALTWLPIGSSCAHSETKITGKKTESCTEAGYTGDTICKECNLTLKRGDVIPAKGHSLKNGACTLCKTRIDGTTGVCGDSVLWTLDSKGTLTISGKGEMYDFSDTMLPPYLDQATKIKKVVIQNGVTSIGDMAFMLCIEMTQATIPSSVTSMGNGAFIGCLKLTSITIPGSIKVIPTLAFEECLDLQTVVLSYGVTTIEPYAFSACPDLTSLTLPNTLENIGICAFWQCTALAKVTLPNSLKTIDEGAFAECTALESITIPKNVTDIGPYAFGYCSKLTKITFTGDAPNISQEAFNSVWADVYPPKYNDTWVYEVMLDYGGLLTWEGKENSCRHQETYIDESNAPTCTEPGIADVKICGICGKILDEGRNAPALGHDYVDGSCTRCGLLDPKKPLPDGVIRLAGSHRFETAFLAANQMMVNLGIEKFNTVVVASGMDFADALSGSYLAAVKEAPILLACQVESINDQVKDYIQENLTEGGTIYILGGENAVPASFETGLEGFHIKRLAGSNRFTTNLLVLEEAGVGDQPILVCTGLNFADSLSASATKLPILLVYGEKLLEDQVSFLTANSGRQLYIIGGEGAVTRKIKEQLDTYGSTLRIAGEDRFSTSMLIAETFFDSPDSAVLAYGANFPDGLCGGPLAATMNAPLILTMKDVETYSVHYIEAKNIRTGIVLGGEKLISNVSGNLIFWLK